MACETCSRVIRHMGGVVLNCPKCDELASAPVETKKTETPKERLDRILKKNKADNQKQPEVKLVNRKMPDCECGPDRSCDICVPF